MKSKWDKEHTALLNLHNNGLTYEKIGLLYGVSRQCIQQVFRRLKIKSKPREKSITKSVRYTDEKLRRCRVKYTLKRVNSRKKSIEFSIPFESIRFPETCPILGIKLDYFRTTIGDNSPSFDRVDPTKGYVVNNVVVISQKANRIKSNATYEELLKITNYIKSMYEYRTTTT